MTLPLVMFSDVPLEVDILSIAPAFLSSYTSISGPKTASAHWTVTVGIEAALAVA